MKTKISHLCTNLEKSSNVNMDALISNAAQLPAKKKVLTKDFQREPCKQVSQLHRETI